MTATKLSETSFLYGGSSEFIEALYAQYLKDPGSVDPTWRAFFSTLGEEAASALDDLERRAHAELRTEEIGAGAINGRPSAVAPSAPAPIPAPSEQEMRAAALDSVRALMLIRAYRVRGHLIANLDPLGLEGEKHHPELDPATYGFTERDLDRPIFVAGVLGRDTATMREILVILKETYCSTIGVEFMHIQYPEQKSWIQERIENGRNRTAFSLEERLSILHRLDAAEGMERFLHIKYPGHKRFSLEGAEGVIPALEAIITRAAELGVEEIVLGMPHRGRLNLLANVMRKSYAAMFAEFEGGSAYPDDVQGSGDVKYHLGTSADRELAGGRTVHISLAANPSHLEAVNPVVEGKTRAKQTLIRDTERAKVMSVLLHGDAAFSGQGLVGETLELSELKGYRTGGTIHIIVNNQIGFTTSPSYSRSSPYPSDVAKLVQAPIVHVNGDDPEAIVHGARIAAEYRQRFKKDVVLDIICYRRHGHSEADEPKFTQPLMYKRIEVHPTVRQIYTERLVAEGAITVKEADRVVGEFHGRLEAELEASKSYRPNRADWLEGYWKGFEVGGDFKEDADTAVALERLKEVGLAITKRPEKIALHPKLVRFLDQRRKMIETGENIDWATAEALAFGTLLKEGYAVRLSGQDSVRGTFSQRHAALVDQNTGERYVALNALGGEQAPIEVIDSMLSEAAVLGFEYGYASVDPKCLVMWEAQFGDFANGAQVIIDQFIASGESKWLRLNGLVMLLPHGYEGQGPEHSSARPERYLQLCAEKNLQVANCTTPASYFHVLRRQMHMKSRKPLIVFTPKSLLRHKLCVSTLADMGPGTRFRRVLPECDAIGRNGPVRRVVLCCGKVYYDLLEERRKRGLDDVAILRIEQLYPFPHERIAGLIDPTPEAEVIWCQEEPRNMGFWSFVAPRLQAILEQIGHARPRPRYAGRAAAASPATGLLRTFLREQEALVNEALAA